MKEVYYFTKLVDLAYIFSHKIRVFGFNWNSIFHCLYFEALEDFDFRAYSSTRKYITIPVKKGETVAINENEEEIKIFDD